MTLSYYNEIEPYCAEWLRNLIAAGWIPAGDVDTRSIKDVQPDDLIGYTQCHFFAGLGGWPYAARLALWPDDRPLWTGSCPCQPFSVAGKGLGAADPRHLWPDFFRLIRSRRPPLVMGEQVAGTAGYGWLDGVQSDLETEGYACDAADIPACSVNAPHIRNRLYWLADAAHQRDEWSGQARGWRARPADGRSGDSGLEHPDGAERRAHAEGRRDVDDRADAGRDQAAGGSELAGQAGHWLGDPRQPGLSPSEREELRGAWRRSQGRAAAESGSAPGGLEHAPEGGRRELRQSSGRDGLPYRADTGTGGVGDAERKRISHSRRREIAPPPREVQGNGAERERLRLDAGESDHRVGGMEHPDVTVPCEGREQRGRQLSRAGVHPPDDPGFWDNWTLVGPDPKGKYRRVEPGVRLLVAGVSGRVAVRRPAQQAGPEAQEAEEHWYSRTGALRAFGNSICPQLAAEVIRSYMETARA